MTPQITALQYKLKEGKVKNKYAVKGKIKKLKKARQWFEFLAR